VPACLPVGWVSECADFGGFPPDAYILAYLHTAICSLRLVRGACVAQGVKKDPSRSCGAIETDRQTGPAAWQVSSERGVVCVWGGYVAWERGKSDQVWPTNAVAALPWPGLRSLSIRYDLIVTFLPPFFQPLFLATHTTPPHAIHPHMQPCTAPMDGRVSECIPSCLPALLPPILPACLPACLPAPIDTIDTWSYSLTERQTERCMLMSLEFLPMDGLAVEGWVGRWMGG